MRVFTHERAGAVVVDRDRVLLVSMEPRGEPRWWHFPGGGVEPGETPKGAAVRELFEETGLRASAAAELLRAGIHGGYHHHFLVTCEDLEIGAVTGPELEYAANADFKAEWVPIADLPGLPVWPRCVAELIAEPIRPSNPLAYVEDDRQSWDGVPGASGPAYIRLAARVVLFRDTERRQFAAIERVRGNECYFTLPGGGVEAGETVHDAIRREGREELGLEVVASEKLAVVVYGRLGQISLQTYCEGAVIGGEFGTGIGDEFTAERQRLRGSYKPPAGSTSAISRSTSGHRGYATVSRPGRNVGPSVLSGSARCMMSERPASSSETDQRPGLRTSTRLEDHFSPHRRRAPNLVRRMQVWRAERRVAGALEPAIQSSFEPRHLGLPPLGGSSDCVADAHDGGRHTPARVGHLLPPPRCASKHVSLATQGTCALRSGWCISFSSPANRLYRH